MGQRLGQWRLLCSMTVEAALFHAVFMAYSLPSPTEAEAMYACLGWTN